MSKRCEWCNKEFIPTSNKQKFCCLSCAGFFNNRAKKQSKAGRDRIVDKIILNRTDEHANDYMLEKLLEIRRKENK